MKTLGIDPDTKNLSIATWDEDGPVAAFVVHAVGRGPKGEQSQVRMARLLQDTAPGIMFDGAETIAIEGQQIDGRRARPRDLFTLAHTTGSAISWCARWFPDARIVVPTPTEWKGGVAKHAMQARLYKSLGWGYEIVGTVAPRRYAVPNTPPPSFNHITKGQWKHVGDALLLAKWGYENR